MSEIEFLNFLIGNLDSCGIPYMITGSVASGFHGEPRTSFDIDAVIEGTSEQLERFVSSVADRCYVSPEAAREALARRSMFNVIDLNSGIKADLIFRKERPFSVMEFSRRRLVQLSGLQAEIVSAEDSILSKLEWRQSSESTRQYHDALAIAASFGERLDLPYLRHWASELKVGEALEQLLAEAQID